MRALDVVAREAEGGLGEVVRAEGEELRVGGDLAGGEAGAWQLDHRADAEVVLAEALLGAHPEHHRPGQLELARRRRRGGS